MIAVVTGASAGVGRATVRAFARRGVDVGLIARGLEGLEAAQREVEISGQQALAVAADVADPDQVEAAAARIERELGPIDVWVNNAMVSVFAPVKDLRPEEIRRVTEVTYLGVVYGTLAALKRMLPRDHGVIIQVGSALAYRGIPLQAAYCGAKHAIQGFTESLRCELLHDGSAVRITMVHLPAMNTPHFDWVRSRMPREPQPVPPIYQPEIAAESIVWAAGDGSATGGTERREVSVGMTTVAAILANNVAPGLFDRYLARTGFDSQQTDVAADPGRRDNLWQPVPGDRGAHGRFDDRSITFSIQAWMNRRLPVLAAATAGSVAAWGAWKWSNRPPKLVSW